MNRKEFLVKLGFSGAAIVAVSTLDLLSSCSPQNSISPSGTVDFTISLTDPSYSALNSNGGYIVKDNVVVARTDNGSFAAVTVVCSHQGNPYVQFDAGSNSFFCPVHGAQYSTTGQGLNSNGRNGLRTYHADLSGTNLHVYS
jgi:cytochrome b6-f complex iron-sulfur subunit